MDRCAALIEKTPNRNNGFTVRFIVKEPKKVTAAVKMGVTSSGTVDGSLTVAKGVSIFKIWLFLAILLFISSIFRVCLAEERLLTHLIPVQSKELTPLMFPWLNLGLDGRCIRILELLYADYLNIYHGISVI